jgi:hypothetical protein
MALGADYIDYSQALDETHQKGIKRIETDLLQVPSSENGDVAIVKATVELTGDQGSYTGLGDCSPHEDPSGKKPAATAPIRMAETRAKSRAFRDAINKNRPVAGDIADEESNPITLEQLSQIQDLVVRVPTLGNLDKFEEAIKVPVESLSEAAAHTWIIKLSKRLTAEVDAA